MATRREAFRFDGVDFESFTAEEKESLMALIKNAKKLLETEIKVNGTPGWLTDLGKKVKWRKKGIAEPTPSGAATSGVAEPTPRWVGCSKRALSGVAEPAPSGDALLAPSGAASGAKDGTSTPPPNVFF